MKTNRRISLKTLVLGGCALAALAAASQASAGEFTIASQDLQQALHQFASQGDQQVLFSTSAVQGKRTSGFAGEADPERALQALLAGTGMTYRRQGDTFLIAQTGEGGSPQSGSAAGGGADAYDVEALVVTAQKKEEQIQDVPIAISAFTQKSLDAQKIEGGFDLLKAIPNVTFSKSNFSGYNFSIRGIGTKAISATTDPGVAVAYNNTTLIVNRLFEQEYYDIERVEVLRGPQGTLYGRNATSGVINVLSARPQLGEFEGEVELELGNYNAQRVRGMLNVPIGDRLAIRMAGAMTKRDGFGTNLAASDPNVTNEVREDVDGRDLWSGRVTVGWEPIDAIRVNAMWERFEEDDNRVRTSKQLCHHDAGIQAAGDFTFDTDPLTIGTTSQGCLPGSLYADGAFGTPNGASLPYIGSINVAVTLGGIARSSPGMGLNPYYLDTNGGFYSGPNAGEAPCERAATLQSMLPIDVCQPDPYGGRMQSRDLRTIHSTIEPTYRAKADIFELSLDIDLTDSLTFTSQTVYTKDEFYASQDYNRFSTSPIFSDSATAGVMDFVPNFPGFPQYGGTYTPNFSPEALATTAGGYYNVTPGGVYTDPQLGPSNSLLAQDLSKASSDQFNQEFRLVSNFDAPLNFSLGSNFTRFETLNDYYVFINALSLFTNFFPFNTHEMNCDWDLVAAGGLDYDGSQALHNPFCIYVDPNPLESIDGTGHNYFRSANPYELTSSAIFGELYWQATEALKVTLGARMTWDRKVFSPVPSQLLLHDYRWHVEDGLGPESCTNGAESCPLGGTGVGGRGSVPLPDIVQEWREPTGRIIVDWKPDLAFTDETMVYGSISHGYKGGGANPPNIAPPAGYFNAINSGVVSPPTFDPEYIDAFEVGTKNTLMGGALVLNGSAFFYDYTGYQVSKIVDRSASNENFDAKIWGAELEWIFSPVRNLRFNGTVGYLQTEIAEGERSIDLMDRTQGGTHSSYLDADGVEHALTFTEWTVHKPFVTNSSNCVVPLEVLRDDALYNNYNNFIAGLCPGGGIGSTGSAATYTFEDGRTYTPGVDSPNGGAGFFAEIGGHELPNAPHWTASVGGQYRFALPGGWDGTARADFYWQDKSFARVYNTEYDRLRSWTNTNFSVWVENPDWGVTAEVYVKNVFDETPITDAFLNSDDSGLTTNVFTLDPRLVGVSVRKTF